LLAGADRSPAEVIPEVQELVRLAIEASVSA